jgi:hypothetical protein
MSTNLLKYGDLMDIEFMKAEFLDKIESCLDGKLKIASYPKKKAKQRLYKIQTEENHLRGKRFLEDHFMTISDIIIFFFINKSIHKFLFLKFEIETSYKKICEWYNLMLDDENIKFYIGSGSYVVLNYLEELKKDKISDKKIE